MPTPSRRRTTGRPSCARKTDSSVPARASSSSSSTRRATQTRRPPKTETSSEPSANTGKLSLFFLGNENVTGLDNTAFLSNDKISFVEDAGDTLHRQRSDDTRAHVSGINAGFDSGFVFDVNTNYANGTKPIRWLAQGRDGLATIDAANSGFGKNDQDNEITGVHVSDGDTGTGGILGAKQPHLFHGGWRWFYTQQHGDNFLFEVIPADAVVPGGSADSN
jgi:hypothetical protein